MTIKYRMLEDGGFVVGDTDTKRTCYSFPSSPNATAAVRQPATTALSMMRVENAFRLRDTWSWAAEYDSANWARLAIDAVSVTLD